jgi:hypothetical protein
MPAAIGSRSSAGAGAGAADPHLLRSGRRPASGGCRSGSAPPDRRWDARLYCFSRETEHRWRLEFQACGAAGPAERPDAADPKAGLIDRGVTIEESLVEDLGARARYLRARRPTRADPGHHHARCARRSISKGGLAAPVLASRRSW